MNILQNFKKFFAIEEEKIFWKAGGGRYIHARRRHRLSNPAYRWVEIEIKKGGGFMNLAVFQEPNPGRLFIALPETRDGRPVVGPPVAVLLVNRWGKVNYSEGLDGDIKLKGGEYLPVREVLSDGRVLIEGEDIPRRVKDYPPYIHIPRRNTPLRLGDFEIGFEGTTRAASEGWPKELTIYEEVDPPSS